MGADDAITLKEALSVRADQDAKAAEESRAALVEQTKTITNAIAAFRADVCEHFAKLESTEKTLADAVGRLQLDVTDLRGRTRVTEDDIRRLSERTKGTATDAARTSDASLEHEAKLAEAHSRQEKLEKTVDELASESKTQTAILRELAAVARNPLVKSIAKVGGTALLTYLALKYGVHLP